MVSKPQGYSFTVGLQVAWSTISPTAAMALLRGKVALSGPTLLENRVVLTCEHGQEQMLSAYQVVNLLCFKSEIIERNRTRRRNSRVKASRVSPMHERWLAHTHTHNILAFNASCTVLVKLYVPSRTSITGQNKRRLMEEDFTLVSCLFPLSTKHFRRP